MERKEYKYNTMFSEETNENMKVFHNIREDCKLILNGEKHLDWASGKTSPEPTDDIVHNFNEYLKSHIDEENAGILRTLLTIAKPYRDNIAVKETIDTLSIKLRENYPDGLI
jgi:hypothetical protein